MFLFRDLREKARVAIPSRSLARECSTIIIGGARAPPAGSSMCNVDGEQNEAGQQSAATPRTWSPPPLSRPPPYHVDGEQDEAGQPDGEAEGEAEEDGGELGEGEREGGCEVGRGRELHP